MHDEDVFTEATRVEDWTHLAGSGAEARAQSSRLRRTRYAGIAGATTAAAVAVAAIASTFGPGGADGSTASAVTSVTSPASPAHTTSQPPAKGTMGALFQQWKSCPDSQLSAAEQDLTRRWRDACHRDVATLSALLPDYDVTPAVSGIEVPKNVRPADLLAPDLFDHPSFVVPAGYTPQMGPSLYRIADQHGVTTKVVIRAYGHDDQTRPATGQAVTLPNGLHGWLALGTALDDRGRLGYEIYILDHGKTFSMFTLSGTTMSFDFKAVATSPQFADMAAKALAEPES